MAPSTLDLMVLTFNCAKNFINVAVFANHLQAAFNHNATSLPDLVVLSLQEVAPMSYSFIGGYLLNPYLARFEEAVNQAAAQHSHEHQETPPVVSVTPTIDGSPKLYTLVRARNVGYTAIVMLARDPSCLQSIQEAEVGFGAAEMGNKGAVGLRILYKDNKRGSGELGESSTAELTFVSTHLAAMEWNLHRRNANWAAIMRSMTFENPEEVINKHRESSHEENDDSGESTRLLHDNHQEQHARLQRRLHDISVFKPSSHLFVAGDLNYRISTTSPPPYAAFPSLDENSEHYYPTFFPLDQLTREKEGGRTLHGLTEHEVRFPPTYKYDVQPRNDTSSELEMDVPFKFASHRYPSWTDRVLFLDVPSCLKSRQSPPTMTVRAYDALPVIRTSDHRPVYLRVEVPLISPTDLAPPDELSEHDTSSSHLSTGVDPRVRLPVEVDPEAWERRAAARRKEVMAGWSMFLWSTRQGAVILATVLCFGVGTYWLFKGF